MTLRTTAIIGLACAAAFGASGCGSSSASSTAVHTSTATTVAAGKSIAAVEACLARQSINVTTSGEFPSKIKVDSMGLGTSSAKGQQLFVWGAQATSAANAVAEAARATAIARSNDITVPVTSGVVGTYVWATAGSAANSDFTASSACVKPA